VVVQSGLGLSLLCVGSIRVGALSLFVLVQSGLGLSLFVLVQSGLGLSLSCVGSIRFRGSLPDGGVNVVLGDIEKRAGAGPLLEYAKPAESQTLNHTSPKNRYSQASRETQNREVRLDQILMTRWGWRDGREEEGEEGGGVLSWSTL
jgi:hypothetical protein